MNPLGAADAASSNPSAAERAAAHREFLWFLLIAFLLLAAGIGLRDPWPSDEPRFALVARQMVESGDWLFPHRGSELYSDKPPLLFWLQALSFELLRSWRIAFLLPSLLAGLLTLGLVWDLGRRLWSPRVGLYAAAALLLTLQFTWQFKRAQIDPLVTLWITLANWGLLIHLLRGPRWGAYWLGCAAAGFGVISKGVGVLALLMLLPYLLLRWRGWPGVLRTRGAAWRWLAGVGFFLAPILAWLLPMLFVAAARGGPEYAGYVQDLLLRQTAGRYASSWAHQQPFWYYLPTILFAWLPLSLAYPGLIPRWLRAWRARDARIALPLCWVGLLVVFFSIPSGKREVYVLPALPMLALVAAPWLEELLRTRWLRAAALAFTAAAGFLLLGGGAAGYAGRLGARMVERGLPAAGAGEWLALLALGGLLLLLALVFRLRRGAHALCAGLAATWLVWGLALAPMLNAQSSAASLMQRVGRLIGSEAELGLVAWKEQNLLMADRPARDFGFDAPWPEQFAAAARWLDAQPGRRWVFALDEALGDCVERSRALALGRVNRRDWWLFQADALVPSCVPRIDPKSAAGLDSGM